MRRLRPALLGLTITIAAASAGFAPSAMGADTIYWTTPWEADKIYSGNLDGSSTTVGEVDTGSAILDTPWGVGLVPAAGRIYWANYVGGGPNARISWASLDGSGSGNLATGAATLNFPGGIVVDHAGG